MSHPDPSTAINPYAPPLDATVVKAGPRLSPRPRLYWLDFLNVWLLCLVCVVGSAAAFVDIESIIVSGSMVSILGLLLIVRARIVRNWPFGDLLGFSALLIAVSTFLVIFLNEWSPSDARNNHVPAVLAAYAASVPVLSALASNSLRRQSKHQDPRNVDPEVGAEPNSGMTHCPSINDSGSASP